MSYVTTLEELKDFLDNKYQKEWTCFSIEEVLKASLEIINQYELESDEIDYVLPLKPCNEDQSAKATMINASKAKKIILGRVFNWINCK